MFETSPTTGLTIVTSLPALVGSDKQLAWATEIRSARANWLANDIDNRFKSAFLAGKVTREQKPEALKKWWAAHAAELTETSAVKWIERR